MIEALQWFTDLGNSKIAALLIFFPLFISIIIYVYASKQRSQRLESYKYIPFDDDESVVAKQRAVTDE